MTKTKRQYRTKWFNKQDNSQWQCFVPSIIYEIGRNSKNCAKSIYSSQPILLPHAYYNLWWVDVTPLHMSVFYTHKLLGSGSSSICGFFILLFFGVLLLHNFCFPLVLVCENYLCCQLSSVVSLCDHLLLSWHLSAM